MEHAVEYCAASGQRLVLAPKSNAHLRTLMHVLFNAAMRWDLIPYQHNPMSFVRVKDSSKRLKEPKFLMSLRSA